LFRFCPDSAHPSRPSARPSSWRSSNEYSAPASARIPYSVCSALPFGRRYQSWWRFRILLVMHPDNVTFVAAVVINPRILAGTREDSAVARHCGQMRCGTRASGENASIYANSSSGQTHGWRLITTGACRRSASLGRVAGKNGALHTSSNEFIHAGHAARGNSATG